MLRGNEGQWKKLGWKQLSMHISGQDDYWDIMRCSIFLVHSSTLCWLLNQLVWLASRLLLNQVDVCVMAGACHCATCSVCCRQHRTSSSWADINHCWCLLILRRDKKFNRLPSLLLTLSLSRKHSISTAHCCPSWLHTPFQPKLLHSSSASLLLLYIPVHRVQCHDTFGLYHPLHWSR